MAFTIRPTKEFLKSIEELKKTLALNSAQKIIDHVVKNHNKLYLELIEQKQKLKEYKELKALLKRKTEIEKQIHAISK